MKISHFIVCMRRKDVRFSPDSMLPTVKRHLATLAKRKPIWFSFWIQSVAFNDFSCDILWMAFKNRKNRGCQSRFHSDFVYYYYYYWIISNGSCWKSQIRTYNQIIFYNSFGCEFLDGDWWLSNGVNSLVNNSNLRQYAQRSFLFFANNNIVYFKWNFSFRYHFSQKSNSNLMLFMSGDINIKILH